MNSSPTNSVPDARFLSNGRYATFFTAAGTGQSRRFDHVVNRWLNDSVEDSYGQFIYLRDADTGEVWSVGMQPMQNPPDRYEFSSSSGHVQLVHQFQGISTRLKIVVPPDDDLEVRQLQLTNLSERTRRLEVTSYFEAVLNWQGADVGHPAFSKLFLQTDFLSDDGMLIVERRPRSHDETWPVLFHSLIGSPVLEWETDRHRFLGRGNSAATPSAMNGPLSGTVGNVLDPCCSLRTIVELNAGASIELSFITGLVESRAAAQSSSEMYGNPADLEQTCAAATQAEQTLLTKLGITDAQAVKFQSIAAAMIYQDRRLKSERTKFPFGADANPLFNRHHVPRDRMLIIVRNEWEHAITQETLLARRYWDAKGLPTNLLVLSDAPVTPSQKDGNNILVIQNSELSEAELGMLLTAATLVVQDDLPKPDCLLAPLIPTRHRSIDRSQESPPETEAEPLQFFNGFGGFNKDGSEYVIRIPREGESWKRPPLPWVNVVANENFGFLVSESGASCTWARNSQAHRLTPWSNEPVSDPHGEAIYLRDEVTGDVYSPLPGPVGASCDYEVRHGFGYSEFTSTFRGLEHRVTLFVPRHDPVKIVRVRLTNHGDSTRKLSLTSYQQLILGGVPQQPSLIVTQSEADGSLRAWDLAGGDFQGGIAFADVSIDRVAIQRQSLTCDRLAFLGRHGSPRNPAALQQGADLNGSTGAGLAPCFAQQRAFSLAPGQTIDCVILLGESLTSENAAELIKRYRNPATVDASLEEVQDFWKQTLARVQVETPSPALNIMVNGWFAYQTLCCRIWARSGFYQSSGAFGFRDQLQDAGNLLPLDPHYAREQILLHARHQFQEGDVLHWWHPKPIDRGVRTRFSDDLLWLPFVVADYLQATGDDAVLDSRQPFLTAPLLKEGEDENFLRPMIASEEGNVYEHCCRAIDRSLPVGSHGLPLMGTGDWNDGMNRVGRLGRGESVWMGFFLYRILGSFIPVCERRGDLSRAQRYQAHRDQLSHSVNDGGWDGEWYRRAYYDNGDPLGSATNDECRIDALAQAWAVISGAAPPDRAKSAMNAMHRELISETDGIIRLLTPPFVNTKNDPGYIKGYVAGVRENGGQYTHAACWAVMALAEHEERDLAMRLLEMLLPISHGRTADEVARYKIEPYVLPGDIYGADPLIGRGGWSWYTGSSGWMFRVAVESILGARFEGRETLVLTPCIPNEWPAYRVTLQRPTGTGVCNIVVENPQRCSQNIVSVTVNDQPMEVSGRSVRVPLSDNDDSQEIRIILG